MSGHVGNNAEARFRARAARTWGVALFLSAVLAGALAWLVVLQPAWDAAQMRAGLGPELDALGWSMLREVIAASPAILLALGAWEAAGVARRLAHGDDRLSRSASSISHMGFAVLLAGLMAMIGAPSVTASLAAGEPALRLAFSPLSLALTVLGMVVVLAARALRDAG